MGKDSIYHYEHLYSLTLEGIKNFIIYDPSNIVKNDLEQSIKNLHAASHNQKEISLLLDVNIGLVRKFFKNNIELKKTIANSDQMISTGITNLLKKGKALEDIAKIFNCTTEELKECL